jgi:hypothetical protein
MARQSGVSTPIFDELLREMTEGMRPPDPSAPAQDPAAAPDSAPRRRHRAD